jgi:hypothetical protein
MNGTEAHSTQLALYIVSNETNITNNYYKVGIHTGIQSKLLSRYRTSLIDPIIIFFKYHKDAKIIEQQILSDLDDIRIKNNNSRKTEWVECSKTQLLKYVDIIILKRDRAQTYSDLRRENDQLQYKNAELAQKYHSLEQTYSMQNQKYIAIIDDWKKRYKLLTIENATLKQGYDELKQAYDELNKDNIRLNVLVKKNALISMKNGKLNTLS